MPFSLWMLYIYAPGTLLISSQNFYSLMRIQLLALVSVATAIPHIHKRQPVLTTVLTLADVVTDNVDVTVYVDDDATYTDFPTTTVSPEASADNTVEFPPSASATFVSSASAASDASIPSVSASSYGSASGSASASAPVSSGSYGTYSGDVSGDLKAFQNPAEEFQDGVYDCLSVPTGNGVISLDWLGIDGWASVTNSAGNTANTCKDGYWCSYACQAGMSKTQWPSAQPSSGESRGGLLCKNGKLYRTNKSTKYLCEWGVDSARVVSKVSDVISICRTDYPGSENMCLPTRLTPGSAEVLTVVDGDSYYKWEGKPTSAQYYVNNAGVDVHEGCLWGTSAGTVGNWAPVNLGAGSTGGVTYLSIIPNPNNKTPPNYNIKIQAGPGATQSGSCSYINGVYSSSGGSGSDGCTVGVTGGYSEFIFY